MANDDTPPSEASVCRRRFLIKSLLGAAAVSTSALPAVARDGYAPGRAKIPKAAAHYQNHPHGEERCGACRHFRPPGSCEIVSGRISPEGWCRYFEG